jgi:tetratricopeptide (TPR) repeat protein
MIRSPDYPITRLPDYQIRYVPPASVARDIYNPGMPRKSKALSLALLSAAACSRSPVPTVPLYDNLGGHHHEISTSSPEAQKYFDQGVRLSYAFNHGEAIRAFKQAIAIDGSCAMCFWGVAFALGPNINAPITEPAATEAYQAIEQARKLAGNITDRERAYIDALAKRYAADPRAARPPLDAAYAEAMRALAQRFPDDLDAATLFAQSLMDTSPWNYWNIDGTAREFTGDVLAALESVLKRQPDHAGAIHLYIHAVEASPNPGRAEAYADKLAALMPVPATSCTCPRTSTCGRAVTAMRRWPTRTQRRPTNRTSRVIARRTT